MPEFDNTYARLPDRFYASMNPTKVGSPAVIRVNEALAKRLGFSEGELTADVLVGNEILDGADPIATAYAGHQFGGFSPQLGDGRAVLLGEVLDDSGERFDVQLKGSGRTPFSRRGDGRSPLGPVLREYIVSEAMFALGVPTTRSLGAATTGEPVYRHVAHPGAVLTRVASSHLRVGTVEYFAAREDLDALQQLVGYTLERHYPDAEGVPAVALLTAVIERQAKLVAHWQCLGFIHGVMNTDNVLLCGETVDYGPCAYMDAFDEDQVFSSIDSHGRYAYGNQPAVMHWNMGCLARALVPLLEGDEQLQSAQDALDSFPNQFKAAYTAGLSKKLGLRKPDVELFDALLTGMQTKSLDYTLTFSRLTDSLEDEGARARVEEDLEDWVPRWREALAADGGLPAEQLAMMRAANPVYIARNHQVEAAIAEAESGDFARFHRLIDVLAAPFERRASDAEFEAPPLPNEIVTATFCGT